MDSEGKKPHISYPCVWEYCVIGRNETALRDLIFEIMPREYDVKLGRHSSKGNFVSLYVKVEVLDEKERNALFTSLQKHKEVKIVF